MAPSSPTTVSVNTRDGDFDALLEVLDPDVELRIDGGVLRAEASRVLHGADPVAGHTATYSELYPFVRPALVNGAAGAVVAPRGRVFSVMAFTVTNGKIVQIDALLDPERLARSSFGTPQGSRAHEWARLSVVCHRARAAFPR
jgi:hypothetical protein